jgi:predicted nuclease with RNAse H fold
MKVSESSFIGVNLRTSELNPSSLAVLNHHSQVAHLGPVFTNDDLLRGLETYQPALIAIGSPLCLPAGLTDLEPTSDTNAAPPENRGRQLERELASMGISCLFTGRGSLIHHLIYRGIGLKSQLNRLGYQVIEVYPHATRVILFGNQNLPRKGSRIVASLKERLPSLINGMEPLYRKHGQACW